MGWLDPFIDAHKTRTLSQGASTVNETTATMTIAQRIEAMKTRGTVLADREKNEKRLRERALQAARDLAEQIHAALLVVAGIDTPAGPASVQLYPDFPSRPRVEVLAGNATVQRFVVESSIADGSAWVGDQQKPLSLDDMLEITVTALEKFQETAPPF
jgi:hypothetical protein